MKTFWFQRKYLQNREECWRTAAACDQALKPADLSWTDCHTCPCVFTWMIKFFWAAFSVKGQPERIKNKKSSSINGRVLGGQHMDSLCKSVVVGVAFWCCRGEKIRVWRSFRLGVGELEWPLIGHMLGVLVGWIGGELVPAVTEQTVRSLQTQVRAVRRWCLGSDYCFCVIVFTW